MKDTLQSVILYLACLYLTTASFAQTEPARAVAGVLDLSHWDFDRDGPINLAGEWEFYWQQLLDPADFAQLQPPKPSAYVQIPAIWNDLEVNNTVLTGDGYATYRLQLKLNKANQRLMFKALAAFTAYRLYVDGQELTANGVVGTNAETMTPREAPHTAAFYPQNRNIELILQVSNFHHNKGGVPYALELGEETQMRKARERNLAFDLFLFGSIFIMGMYHIGLYMLRRSDYAPLFFGILCFNVALRTILSSEIYLVQVFPQLPWALLNVLNFLTLYVGTPIFALFFYFLFPHLFSKNVLKVILALSAVFTSIIIVTPARIFTHTLPAYQLITVLAFSYVLYIIIKALLKKEEGTLVVLFGFGMLFITFLNDILYNNQVINTTYLFPVGLFSLIFSQSFLLSIKFSNSFRLTEQVRASYERFVPHDFLDLLNKKSILEVELGQQIQSNMSILFSDIRSFTALSESLSPQENFNFLNSYLERMEPPIQKNRGVIDKYIGDAIMALFAHGADNAVGAAIDMQLALHKYNEHRGKVGYDPIKVGIGIHTGEVMLGTIGAKNRMEGTVIGDAVNLAARIEGMTKNYGAPILISDATYRNLSQADMLCIRILDRVIVKGKTEPVTVYEVFDADPDDIKAKKLSTQASFEEAVALYSKMAFSEVIKRMNAHLRAFPEDKVADIYIERCIMNLEGRKDETWTGITLMDSK